MQLESPDAFQKGIFRTLNRNLYPERFIEFEHEAKNANLDSVEMFLNHQWAEPDDQEVIRDRLRTLVDATGVPTFAYRRILAILQREAVKAGVEEQKGVLHKEEAV